MLNDKQIKEIEFLVEQGYTITQVSNLTNHGFGDYSAMARRYHYHKAKYKKAIMFNKIQKLEFDLRIQKNKAKENLERYQETKAKYSTKCNRVKELCAEVREYKKERNELLDKIKELESQLKKANYDPHKPGPKPKGIATKEEINSFVYVVAPFGSKIAGCYNTEKLAMEKAKWEDNIQKRSFKSYKCQVRN